MADRICQLTIAVGSWTPEFDTVETPTIANMRAIADLGVTNVTSDVIATRGERLALSRARCRAATSGPRRSTPKRSQIIEIDADEPDRGARHVRPRRPRRCVRGTRRPVSRRRSGRPCAHVVGHRAGATPRLNRRELPATTPDWVNIDHRRATAVRTRRPDRIHPCLVGPDAGRQHLHRGRASAERSRSGRHPRGAMGLHKRDSTPSGGRSSFVTVEGDLINRGEIFDEADLDAALARFDELSRPAPQLENAASQVNERFDACFAARDWDAMAEMLADDIYHDDRRRVVGAGIRRPGCRDREHAGDRRPRASRMRHRPSSRPAGSASPSPYPLLGPDQRPEAFHIEILDIVEIDADNRIAATYRVRPRRLRRRLRGARRPLPRGRSGRPRAHVVSHRGRLRRAQPARTPATTSDWVNVDHRRASSVRTRRHGRDIRAVWDQAPDLRIYIEAVHRLS